MKSLKEISSLMNVPEIKNIIHNTIDGVYVAEHDESGHKYRNTKTGKMQVSVTTKLQIMSRPHLMPWAVKMGALWLMEGDRAQKLLDPNETNAMIQGMQMASTDIRDTAGDIGTAAHNAIEDYINEWIETGEKPEDIRKFAKPGVLPASIASMRAAEKWFNKQDIVPIAAEILVGNDKYSAGQLDFLCLLNGKLTLIDHKTSNSIDKNGYSMQTAAYRYFFNEMTGLKIEQIKILHLSKSYDKFEIHNVKNIASAYKAFKSACQLYDWVHSTRDKIIRDIKKIKI
jgi:hypothetical protein